MGGLPHRQCFFRGSLSYDIGLKLANLSSYANRLAERCAVKSADIIPYVFGHVGEGNLHVMFALHDSDLAQRDTYDQLVYETLAEFTGSTISAEHGIGTEKRAVLAQSLRPETLAAFQQLKTVFDPNNRLNPGKIISAWRA